MEKKHGRGKRLEKKKFPPYYTIGGKRVPSVNRGKKKKSTKLRRIKRREEKKNASLLHPKIVSSSGELLG